MQHHLPRSVFLLACTATLALAPVGADDIRFERIPDGYANGVSDEHRGENHISDCVDEGDLNGDGDVDAEDLDALHDELGICKGDVNHDGVVDGKDLGSVLAVWGLSCDG